MAIAVMCQKSCVSTKASRVGDGICAQDCHHVQDYLARAGMIEQRTPGTRSQATDSARSETLVSSESATSSWLDVVVRMRESRLLSALAVYAGLWCLLTFALSADSRLSLTVMVWGRYLILLLGITLALRVARLPSAEPRDRLAWALLAAAFAAVAIGDVIWGWLTIVQQRSATYSIANLFYLGYFPLLVAGLLALPRVFRSRGDALTFALDAATVAVGIGMMLWYSVLRPALGEVNGGPWQQVAIALAYPIGDMLSVLGVALVLLRQPQGPRRRVSLWLALALLCSLVGDTLWIFGKVLGLASTTGGSHLLWLLQVMFFLVAARAELQRQLFPVTSQPQSGHWHDSFHALPIAASVLGFVLLAVIARSGERSAIDGALLAASLLLLLVIARQLVGQREHAGLLAQTVAQQGESRFAALIEHASDAILILNEQGELNYASPAAATLFGGRIPADQTALSQYLHPQDRPAIEDYIEGCRRGHVRQARLVLRFGAGETWATTETALSNLLADPKVTGIVLNVRDVSDRHALEEQLRFEALHDPLSGLPNRELFRDRVSRALVRAQEESSTMAVAILGLDQFSRINDGLGRDTGDAVLATTASLLDGALTGSESLARLGGDEFGLLFDHVDSPAALHARLESLRAAVGTPRLQDGHQIRLAASIGYVTSSGEPDTDTDTLLRNADIALHQAKSEGGERCRSFEAESRARIMARLRLEGSLPELLANEAFTLRFEPIMRCSDQRPLGLRVHLDWRDRVHAPGSITEALAVARAAGLHGLTGRWLLAAVQRDLSALLRYLPEANRLWLHLPLEPSMLQDPAFVDDLSRLLRRLDIAPANLVFEIAASELDPQRVGARPEALLRALQVLGVGLAISEFGDHEGALRVLDGIPPNALVLSASMLRGTEEAPAAPSRALQAALALASALGLRAIATGIDHEHQRSQLLALRCDAGSGALYAPSLPYERVLTWLAAQFAESAG